MNGMEHIFVYSYLTYCHDFLHYSVTASIACCIYTESITFKPSEKGFLCFGDSSSNSETAPESSSFSIKIK